METKIKMWGSFTIYKFMNCIIICTDVECMKVDLFVGDLENFLHLRASSHAAQPLGTTVDLHCSPKETQL